MEILSLKPMISKKTASYRSKHLTIIGNAVPNRLLNDNFGWETILLKKGIEGQNHSETPLNKCPS
ncbi:hypothetical protein GCM10008986_14480 [Salinibacillus aidingensis]|uniref:Uncharacterized protein n=1 Tax=Salinibacillus aidingensis TaxID=237684 RepID=A0ABP3KZ03_9BACI